MAKKWKYNTKMAATIVLEPGSTCKEILWAAAYGHEPDGHYSLPPTLLPNVLLSLSLIKQLTGKDEEEIKSAIKGVSMIDLSEGGKVTYRLVDVFTWLLGQQHKDNNVVQFAPEQKKSLSPAI